MLNFSGVQSLSLMTSEFPGIRLAIASNPAAAVAIKGSNRMKFMYFIIANKAIVCKIVRSVAGEAHTNLKRGK